MPGRPFFDCFRPLHCAFVFDVDGEVLSCAVIPSFEEKTASFLSSVFDVLDDQRDDELLPLIEYGSWKKSVRSAVGA